MPAASGSPNTLLGAFLALNLAAQPAFALRCGSKIIKEGVSSARVLKHCGEPAKVEYRGWFQRFYAPGYGDTRAGHYPHEVFVEDWTYNFGPNKLMRVLRIEDGWVTDVRKLGYGYRN